jgi:hypothetical protein
MDCPKTRLNGIKPRPSPNGTDTTTVEPSTRDFITEPRYDFDLENISMIFWGSELLINPTGACDWCILYELI